MLIKSILILFSFILGVLCIRLIRAYDIHEKEPFWKMLIVTLIGGLVSTFTALLLYAFISIINIGELQSVYRAILIIGPLEEFSKLFALFVAYFVVQKELNEPLDGIIYMSSVALGFSLIENLLYAILDPTRSFILFLRVITTTPSHILFSAAMGLAFYFYKKDQNRLIMLVLAFFYSSLVHGLWDVLTSANALRMFSFPFLIGLMWILYRNIILMLNYAAAKSPFRFSLKDFVYKEKNKTLETGKVCPFCNNKSIKATFNLGPMKIQKCKECGHFISNRDSLFYIFHRFGSKYENLHKYYYKAPQKHKKYDVLYEHNFIQPKEKTAFFNLEKLSAVLEEMSSKSIANFESKWWFKKSIYLGKNNN